jgi:glycosyl hydrolase family 12
MNVLKVVPLVVVALLAVGCRSVATGGPGIAVGTAMATTSRGSSTPSPSKGTSAPMPAHGTSTPVQSTSVPTASASTSAPTPVITTPTPAPVTATATPAPGVSSSSAAPSPSTSFAWCSSAPFGTESTSDGFLLYNNEWNTAAAGPQTICGNSGASWQVTSTQGGPDATSVKTYPSVQKNYPDEPVGQFTSMTSSYAESMPSSGDFEAAYDIWLNKLSKEVMFWVDNHGQTPAGTRQGTVTLGGLTWTLYATGGGYWAFVLDHNASSGTVDLAAGLRYLESTGALSASDQLWQVNFGWEICSTQNQPEVFRMTNYSLASS